MFIWKFKQILTHLACVFIMIVLGEDGVNKAG